MISRKPPRYFIVTFFMLLSGPYLNAAESGYSDYKKSRIEVESAISELKLLQLVQKIGWSASMLKDADDSLYKLKEYSSLTEQLFDISKKTAEYKRKLEHSASTGKSPGARESLGLLKMEVQLKKAAYNVEKKRYEHYQSENSRASYLDVREAFDEFNVSRREYFEQLQKWIVFSLTNEELGRYFNFAGFRENIVKELNSIFISEAAEKLKVTKEIASFYWDDYCEGRADMAGLFDYFEADAVVNIKEALIYEYGKLLPPREQKKLTAKLEASPDIAAMVKDAKKGIVKNLIHEHLKDELLKIQPELLKYIARKQGVDFSRPYKNLKNILLEYRKNVNPLPADKIFNEEVVPEEEAFINRINSLLKELSVERQEDMRSAANLNRYYMWGDKAGWPLNGIKALEEMLKKESLVIKNDELDIIKQLCVDIEQNSMLTAKYSSYFYRVLDTGRGLNDTLSAGFNELLGPGEQESDVLMSAAYSFVQAEKLYGKYKKLLNDFTAYKKKIDNLFRTDNPENAQDVAQLNDKLDTTFNSYLSGPATVEAVFSDMKSKIGRFALDEDDFRRVAGSMPDGLDPMFAGRIRGIGEKDASVK